MLPVSTFESSKEFKSAKMATMKKIIGFLLLLGTFQLLNAQDLSQNKYEGLLKTALAMPTLNSTTNTYFGVTREAILDKWIASIQKEVADYTFITTSDHESTEIYKVLFGTENSSIVANYSGDGVLLTTYETYHLQSVPFYLESTIEQKFGPTEIQHCTYKVTYKKNKEPFKRFLAQICSEGKSQNIKLDINGNFLK